MGIKCSLLGHHFDDPDVERDREEQGSEVVITITETETCQRCGETRVVSENKEVTTLETPSDIVGDELDEDSPDAEADPASGREPDPAEAPAPDPAETGDTDVAAGSTEPSVETEPDQTGEPGGTAASAPAAEAAGGSGESVDSPSMAAPDVAEAGEDDAVILEDDAAEDADEEGGRRPGEWPQEDSEDPETGWTPTIDAESTPVEEEQPEIEPTDDGMGTPVGTFHCAECGFTAPVESSSLREGDFCPECHRGSLTHQPEAE